MVGNLINNTVLTPGQTGQAGAFVLLVLVVSLVPMLWYVRSARVRGAGLMMTAGSRTLVVQPVAAAAGPAGDHRRLPGLVAAAGAHRGPVLVQLRPVADARGRASRSAGTGATRSARSGTTTACTRR